MHEAPTKTEPRQKNLDEWDLCGIVLHNLSRHVGISGVIHAHSDAPTFNNAGGPWNKVQRHHKEF